MSATLIFPVVSFGGWLFILSWILELETSDCPCSKSWMQSVIKYFTFYLLVANIIFLIYPMRFNWYFVIHFVSVIAFITLTRIYIEILRKRLCRCVPKSKMWMVELTNAFQFVGFGVLVLSATYKKYKPYIKI